MGPPNIQPSFAGQLRTAVETYRRARFAEHSGHVSRIVSHARTRFEAEAKIGNFDVSVYIELPNIGAEACLWLLQEIRLELHKDKYETLTVEPGGEGRVHIRASW